MIRIYKTKETHKKVPLFAGMSFIEKFIMVMAPIGITFMTYTILEFTEYAWWLRLGISISITTIAWILIYLFATLMSKLDLD
jgi:hypothetical protein